MTSAWGLFPGTLAFGCWLCLYLPWRLHRVVRRNVARVSVGRMLQRGTPSTTHGVPNFVISCLVHAIRRSRLGRVLHQCRSGSKMTFVRRLVKCFSLGLRLMGRRGVPTRKQCVFTSGRPLNKLSKVYLSTVVNKHFSKGVHCLIGSLLLCLSGLESVFIPVGGRKTRKGGGTRLVRGTCTSSGRVVAFPTNLYSHGRGKGVRSAR